ncbi:MAG TPA: acyltransferase [Nitrosomonas sp.]|nr:acyltransferase [Nitrosomonas sp.]
MLRQSNKPFAKRVFILLAQTLRIAFYKYISDCKTNGSAIQHQPVYRVGSGYIDFRGTVNIGYFPSPYYLNGCCYIEARNESARITINDGTWINNNFVAISEYMSITIGKNVLIGTCVEIYDSNFHGLEPDKRKISSSINCAEVIIEDNVFIGSNVKILKGVTIGKNSVVANGSIVTKDIPANVISGGNPARTLKNLNDIQTKSLND